MKRKGGAALSKKKGKRAKLATGHAPAAARDASGRFAAADSKSAAPSAQSAATSQPASQAQAGPSRELLAKAISDAQASEKPINDPCLLEALQQCRDQQPTINVRTKRVDKRLVAKVRSSTEKRTKKTVAKNLHSPQRAGRPPLNQKPGPKPHSIRGIAAVLPSSASTVHRWLNESSSEESDDDDDGEGDDRGYHSDSELYRKGKQGGHNRRVKAETYVPMRQAIIVRGVKGVHTDQHDCVDLLLEIERVCPWLRPKFVQDALDAIRREDFKGENAEEAYLDAQYEAAAPSQTTISRLCFAIGVSYQKAVQAKRSRFRATWPAEVQHTQDNANKFEWLYVLDEFGAHVDACPKHGLFAVGDPNKELLGNRRGPGATFLFCVGLNL